VRSSSLIILPLFYTSSLSSTLALCVALSFKLHIEGRNMGALSKGCGSCKRRKVKCDETRPQCTRCRKAGIECTGFVQRLRFVNEKPRIQSSIKVFQAQLHELSTMSRSSQLIFHSGQICRPQPLSPHPFLENTFPLTAFKDNIFISYLFSKLFEGECVNSLNCGLPVDWIPELTMSPQKVRDKSWDALAAIVFGQAHNSHNLIIDSLRVYGQALSELRNKLSNPDNRYTDSTVASMTALYRYEVSQRVTKLQKLIDKCRY